MNYYLSLKSFNKEHYFNNKVIKIKLKIMLITNIKKFKTILVNKKMNISKMKKIICKQIQFFLDVFPKIKLSWPPETKIFLIKVNIIISNNQTLSGNSKPTFSTKLIIIVIRS